MTFNWPDIPFTGAEVQTFANAYKELAEAIYEDYQTNGDVGKAFNELKMPYRDSEVIKVLLEEGILYGCFIIQQRSGSIGPGTDFNLNNSPFRRAFSEKQIEKLVKNLGCIYTSAGMSASWAKNREKDPSLNDPDNRFNPDGSPNLDDVVGDLIRTLTDESKGDPENLNSEQFFELLRQKQTGDVNFWENFIISLWEGIRAPFGVNPFRNLITTSVRQYLGDDGSPITNSSFPPEVINNLETEIQRLLDRPRGLWPQNSGVPNVPVSGRGGPPFVDVTSQYNEIQKQSFNFQPGDKIVVFPTYTSDLGNLLGVATAVVDSNGNVKSVHDDFDFMYGYEINRSGTNQIPGSPYNQNQRVNGSSWNKNGVSQTAEQVLEEHDGVHRATIINAHESNRGTPVPITITFN